MTQTDHETKADQCEQTCHHKNLLYPIVFGTKFRMRVEARA